MPGDARRREALKGATTVLASVPRTSTRAPSSVESYAPVCSVFRRFLRSNGLRFTPERAMVLDAVLAEEGLFDAERVAANLKRQGHRGSRATIYRTLAHLHDAGILKQVFFGGTQTHYQVIAGRQTKDYLICTQTGRVVEFNSPRIASLCEEISRQFGFEPVAHQLQIFGVSAEGRAKKSK